MAPPLDSAARLLRALGWPLAPAETSPSRGPVGLLTAPHVTLPLPAASEDFELAPYPNPCRFSPLTTSATALCEFDFDPARPPIGTRHDAEYRGGGRRRRGIGGAEAVPSLSTSASTSRSTSPAPSTCSTAGWSDSDSPAACPRRNPQSAKTKATAGHEELEALWRRYWD